MENNRLSVDNNPEFALRFGEKFKRARIEAKLSQLQVAEYLDLSNNYISMVERGNSLMHITLIEKCCELFHKDANFFFTKSKVFQETSSAESLDYVNKKILDAKKCLEEAHEELNLDLSNNKRSDG